MCGMNHVPGVIMNFNSTVVSVILICFGWVFNDFIRKYEFTAVPGVWRMFKMGGFGVAEMGSKTCENGHFWAPGSKNSGFWVILGSWGHPDVSWAVCPV
jgi:hypothetical protein